MSPRAWFVVSATVCALAAVIPAALAEGGQIRQVSIPGKAFAPSQLQVLVGDTVTWQNGDNTDHTVTSNDNIFDSGYIAPGGTFSLSFPRAGRFSYHCTIHKYMKGVIEVVPVALHGPPAPIVAGGKITLQGLAPSGATSVVVEQLGAVHVAHRATPAADGSFTANFRAVRPAVFRARIEQLSSSQILVSVAPRVSAQLRAGVVSARATPARSGARAVLQRYVRNRFAWQTVARGRLDATSRVSLKLPPGNVGRFRILVRGDHGWAEAASQTIVR